MRLILIRHFKTRSNSSGRIMGWGDSPPAPDWQHDLNIVCSALLEHQVQLDAIYSSDLQRAWQTADYFANCRDHPAAVIRSPGLNEVNYGELYAKDKKWVAKHIPAYKTDPDYVFQGGESFRQMQARSVALVESLQQQRSDQTLLLVIHAGVIRALLCHFLGLNYADHLKRRVSHRYIGELDISHGQCSGYAELGKPSGFLRAGVVPAAFLHRGSTLPPAEQSKPAPE